LEHFPVSCCMARRGSHRSVGGAGGQDAGRCLAGRDGRDLAAHLPVFIERVLLSRGSHEGVELLPQRGAHDLLQREALDFQLLFYLFDRGEPAGFGQLEGAFKGGKALRHVLTLP
jgi:hypothetical protein